MISEHRATAEPLRALFVTHAFPRRSGDAPGLFIHRLAVALRERDVHVKVLAPSAPGLAARERVDGIEVERFRYAPGTHERLAYTGTMAESVKGSVSGKLALMSMLAAGRQALRRAAKAYEPHVIHAHWWFPSGLVARSAGKLAPLITTLHGSDVRLAAGTPGAARLYASVARASATVTAVSSWLAARAAQLAPSLQAPQVAPMPVELDLFRPGRVREAGVVLFAGRLNSQKGLEALLRAVPLATHVTAVEVVGDGPDAPAFRALAESLGIAGRVRWLGTLAQPALAERYGRAAAVCVPSVDEGLGLVAVEALLCETPVIAFRSGGLTDVVEHERTGLLVEPGNGPGLAKALDDLLSRSDAGASLGREGRQRAIERFAPDAVAARYQGIYESALSA